MGRPQMCTADRDAFLNAIPVFLDNIRKTEPTEDATNSHANLARLLKCAKDTIGKLINGGELSCKTCQAIELKLKQIPGLKNLKICQARFSQQTREVESVPSNLQLKSPNTLNRSLMDEFLYQPWNSPSGFPLHYSQRQTTIVGNEAKRMLRDDLKSFLSDPRQFCWWFWTGLEGMGKSRIATEACHVAMKQDWQAGFLHQNRIRGFRIESIVIDESKNTLIVVDYVHNIVSELRRLLRWLSTFRGLTRPGDMQPTGKIRLIALERHSESLRPLAMGQPQPQWFRTLFPLGPERAATESMLDCQFPARAASSLHFHSVAPVNATEIILECLSDGIFKPSKRLEERICNETLQLLKGDLRPLHLQLTALALWSRYQDSTAGAFRPFLDFAEVMRLWLRHRIDYRLSQLRTEFDDATATKIIHLMCVATVLRSVALRAVPVHPLLPDPTVIAGRKYLPLLGEASAQAEISGLEPDLIGEWFVREWTDSRYYDSGLTPSELAEIVASVADHRIMVKDFVRRTCRYFHREPIWRALRNKLGRYSTPFGSYFDVRPKQSTLLGGTTSKAEECYEREINRRIEQTLQKGGPAYVVDLMAGGADRNLQLIQKFGARIRLLAIDRDDSRLLKGLSESREHQNFFVERREVDGKIQLDELLQRVFGTPQCDVVIAKKAIHELPWPQQRQLLAQMGAVVRRGGATVLFTDSPDFIDEFGMSRLTMLLKKLQEDFPINEAMAPRIELFERTLFPPALSFDPESSPDHAIFMNLWIKLKDWANFNEHEWEHRYFSSRNQIEAELTNAGFDVSSRSATIERFEMELQATRFTEEAFNRLSYLYDDLTVSDEAIVHVFADNPRCALFWEFASKHLWSEHGASAFGSGKRVNAKMPAPFDVNDLVRAEFSLRERNITFPTLPGPVFEAPIHIFSCERT